MATRKEYFKTVLFAGTEEDSFKGTPYKSEYI